MDDKRTVIAEAIQNHPDFNNQRIADLLQKERPDLFAGILLDSLRRRIASIRLLGDVQSLVNDGPPHSPDGFKFTQTGATAQAQGVSEKRIQSLEDLVDFFQIDLEKWKIKKWECTSYESHAKLRRVDTSYQVKTGYARLSDKHILVPLYRVTATLEENRPLILLNDIKAEILAELKENAKTFPPFEYSPDPLSDCLLELNIFDLHFGKLAWDEETGNNFDIKIAREMFLKCVGRLIEQAKPYPIERVLFPVGNDFFNVDNVLETTARNTPQDEDTRWKKTFVAGRRLLIEAIDRLSEIAPVSVPVIPGNHDLTRAFYLGDALECWYHKSDRVTVDNGAKLRKYVQYGKCLIGYTHGSEEKPDELPYLMANEEPQLWANTTQREWHVGDKHHKRELRWASTEEYKGVVVRYMRSLAGTDVWHYSKGFVGAQRAGEGFVWNRESGIVCEFSATLI